MKGEVGAALDEFRAQYDTGADPATVLTDLAEFNHLVTRLRFVPSAADDASLAEDERRRGLEFAQSCQCQGAVAHLADAAERYSRGAGVEPAGQCGRNGADPHRARRRPADAGRGVEITRPAGKGRPHSERPSIRGSQPPAPPPVAETAPARWRRPVMPRVPPAAPRRCGWWRRSPRRTGRAAGAGTRRRNAGGPIRSLADIAALADTHRDMAFKVLLKRCVRPVRDRERPHRHQPDRRKRRRR